MFLALSHAMTPLSIKETSLRALSHSSLSILHFQIFVFSSPAPREQAVWQKFLSLSRIYSSSFSFIHVIFLVKSLYFTSWLNQVPVIHRFLFGTLDSGLQQTLSPLHLVQEQMDKIQLPFCFDLTLLYSTLGETQLECRAPQYKRYRP